MTFLTRLPRGNVCAAFDTHFLFCRNALSSNVADLDTLFFLPELAACAVASIAPTYFLKSLQPTLEPTLLDLDQKRGLKVLLGARPEGRGEDEAPPCELSWLLQQRPT